MATCMECIHFNPCNSHSKIIVEKPTEGNDWGLHNEVEKECKYFTPTADVVEVVRCKDCAHYIEMEGFDYKGRKARSCVWHSALRRENDYCSDAIRTPKERGGEK